MKFLPNNAQHEIPCYSSEQHLSPLVPESIDPLTDPIRLQALEEVIAATHERSSEFDRMADFAAAALRVPIALITFVDVETQTFKGEHGLPATLAMIRSMPISYSICRYTIRDPQPLLIPDTEIHPLMMNHPSVVEMGIRAYLGIPLILKDGQTVGSLSFVDYVPRHWTSEELDKAESLAAEAVEFLNSALKTHRRQPKA